ncbi:MAG: hypothetical protein QOF03_2038 [Alphaproteobacteria bacterium]|nr:hypothetical protein [Alphaproteobacteria bacterium]
MFGDEQIGLPHRFVGLTRIAKRVVGQLAVPLCPLAVGKLRKISHIRFALPIQGIWSPQARFETSQNDASKPSLTHLIKPDHPAAGSRTV